MRFDKADCVMVCCQMARRGIISVSEMQELISTHSDQSCTSLNQENLLSVFCLMARNGRIPQEEVEELVSSHKKKTEPCVCAA